MANVFVYFTAIFVCVFHLVRSDSVANGTSCSKWECEYNLLLKLTKLEVKISQQGEKIAEQNEKHLQQQLMIESLTRDLEAVDRTSKTLPTVLHMSDGVAQHALTTPRLCLTDKPVLGLVAPGTNGGSNIYGAEYETSNYNTWSNLHDHDVPCVVCHVPHNDVLMVPGSNICPNNYSPEYSGYLMAGHHTHPAAGEYLCVDGELEAINGGYSNHNGYLLYIVQARCGSLECPPYEEGGEVTCVVCSFSTDSQSKSVQPYV